MTRLKNDRMFQLLYLLLEKGATAAPVLAEKLGVSVRTVYRDVDALSSAGVPVYALPGKGGGIALVSGYELDRALLSDEEQNQILFAIQSMRATELPVNELLQKLGGMFHKPVANWIEVDFTRWGYGHTDRNRFDTLKTAVVERRVLRICYCGASGEMTERDVEPIKLIFKDKNWYLQAFCRKADDFRLFRVNRIIALSLTAERFSEQPDPAPPLEPNIMAMVSPLRITLRFTPAAAYRVYDDFTPQSIDRQSDGSLLVNAVYPDDGWAVGYLLTYGTDVEVLQPPLLRRQIAELAEKIAFHHQT